MPIRSLTILVADDEPSVADSLTVLLRARGHRIEAAADGLQAHARIMENPGKFDLLIADNTMPGLTGSELIRKLKAEGFTGKIMVLSGHLTEKLESAYRRLGVDEIVSKPFDLSTVRVAIDRIAAAIGEAPAE